MKANPIEPPPRDAQPGAAIKTPASPEQPRRHVLRAQGLTAGYGHGPVVSGLDIEVGEGEVVALLGANGAGKTTTLLALHGELEAEGTVEIDGAAAGSRPSHQRARAGLMFVTEERSVFMELSVRDNLRLGGVEVETAVAMFPELAARLKIRAGMLSGGEQQMLALARALGRGPRILMADELSMGLAPLVVHRLLAAVRDSAREHAMGALLVEQHVRKALQYADRAYVMRRGRIVLSGSAADLAADLSTIENEYLTNDVEDSTRD